LFKAEQAIKRNGFKLSLCPVGGGYINQMTVYRQAIITFIDIIGFRQIVQSSHDATHIERILKRLRLFGSPAETPSIEDKVDVHSIAFSDSIVRVRFIDGEGGDGALNCEMLDLMRIQGEMIADNVLLRGGVTIGEVYFDGNIVFGKGFNKAYHLESELANFPRIVLDPTVFKTLRELPTLWADHHDIEDEIFYLRSSLVQGDDGLWFIDFLPAFAREVDEPEQYPEYLENFRVFIITAANENMSNLRIAQKYLWLIGYFNRSIAKLGVSIREIGKSDVNALEDLAEVPDWVQIEPEH
jgi:hypothetical protein